MNDELEQLLDDIVLYPAEWQADDYLKARESLIALITRKQDEVANPIYRERNQLVAYLTKQYPSHVAVDPAEPEWPVVYVESPAGQMSWHIGVADLDLFDHLERRSRNSWDGHTTEEKYHRLNQLQGDTND